MTYLRPTPIARVIARGEVLRFGSSSVVMQGALRDAGGKVLAVATATAVPRPFPGSRHPGSCTVIQRSATPEQLKMIRQP